MKLEVFDPAMCCSTGVCGPSVDPALATFAADLDWLTSTGATVRRYHLGQEPGQGGGGRDRAAALLDVRERKSRQIDERCHAGRWVKR